MNTEARSPAESVTQKTAGLVEYALENGVATLRLKIGRAHV